MHKLWLEFDILDDFIEFKRMRALCIRQSCIDRANYMEKVEFSSTKNIKKFWNYVNNLSKDSGIPEEMFFEDLSSKNGKQTCDLFAKNFELVYLQNKSTFHHQLNLSFEQDLDITVDDIKKSVKALENKNTIGPDGLSEFFIKECSN